MATTSAKGKLRSRQNKVTELKQQGNVAFQLLVKSEQGELDIDLKELMAFQLTPIPYSLGTADGFLFNTDKSTVYQSLTKNLENAELPPEAVTLTVIDGNAIFHAMI